MNIKSNKYTGDKVELETQFSEMNSSSQKQKLMFINDEVLPDIFRLITFHEDNIDETTGDNNEINNQANETHKIRTKNNSIIQTKLNSSNIVKI